MPDSADPVVVDADGDLRSLDTPPEAHRAAVLRRRALVVGVAVTVLGGLVGGGVWWYRQVTGDPGLEFYGGPNVYRDEAGTDQAGVHRTSNGLGDQVEVAFVRNGRLYVHFGLSNGGARDVRIEAARNGRYYYWGLDRMSLSTDRDDGFVGTASRYEPFRPFTLRRGETREVRLEFRLADCDPASLQPGAYSVLRDLRVRYRTLGVSRTIDVPFRDAAVALQAMGACEHPILD